MSRELVLRPEAENETTAACEWYERQRVGLGDEFLCCLEATLEHVRREPEVYPLVHERIRRALIRRFPYGVFYLVEPQRIVVLAVFHGRRDPSDWQSRR
jgi:plasmid stabilization system protein ParE